MHNTQPILPIELKPGFSLRTLQSEDYSRGYLNLLSQLTTVKDMSQTQFDEILVANQANYIAVVQDAQGALVGTGTVMIQQKFIRGGGKVGFIEDIVVSDKARGTGLGKLLIQHLMRVGQERGCYKVR